MITLAVVAFNDTPADGTLQVHFDELGGTIGRAGTNQLVLPDPERMVSRVAAQVLFRNGSFAIVERGSNPISLNGRELAGGREAPIASGDRIRICGYEISVKAGATTAAGPADPFSGLFGPAEKKPGAPGDRLLDPLAQPRAAAAPRAAAPAPAEAGGIPDDWDPFATAVPPRPGAAAPRARDALGLDVGAAAPESLVPGFGAPSAAPSSLDQLFGLAPSAGGDPLSNSPLDAPMSQPNMAGSDDPMRALRSAPRAVEAAQPDQMSDLQRPYIPPTMIKPPSQTARAQPPPAPAPAPAPAQSEPTRAQPPAAVSRPVASPVARPAPVPAAAPAPRPAPPRAEATAPPVPAEGADALLAAFRRGLDAPALELPALTPALMELIGQLLHASVRGTLELLHTRAAVKQGMHSEVTAIVAGKNNPLKFSPSVEVALQHLLSPPARGFIAAGPAMHDAYADLRTHQFAYAVGMRATLEAALQRFDPAQIESRLGDRSALRDLLPASRNARLWELFVEHYARVRKDAADDFHAAFGRVFLKAYDEHVRRLEDQRAERSAP